MQYFKTPRNDRTRSSAIAEGPRDALRQLKSCQLLHNFTTRSLANANRWRVGASSVFSNGHVLIGCLYSFVRNVVIRGSTVVDEVACDVPYDGRRMCTKLTYERRSLI